MIHDQKFQNVYIQNVPNLPKCFKRHQQEVSLFLFYPFMYISKCSNKTILIAYILIYKNDLHFLNVIMYLENVHRVFQITIGVYLRNLYHVLKHILLVFKKHSCAFQDYSSCNKNVHSIFKIWSSCIQIIFIVYWKVIVIFRPF